MFEKFKNLNLSGVVKENLAAMRNEILRVTGVKVCDLLIKNFMRFLPQSWQARFFMGTPMFRQVTTIILAQAIGHTMYIFKDKLSPKYQQYLALMRSSAWQASATAMVELTNVDKLFDMLVPDEVKKLLDESMKNLSDIERRALMEGQNDNEYANS